MGTVEVSKGGLDPVGPDLDPLIFLHLGTLWLGSLRVSLVALS